MFTPLRDIIDAVNSSKKEIIKKLKMYDPILVFSGGQGRENGAWKLAQFAYYKEDQNDGSFYVWTFDDVYNPMTTTRSTVFTAAIHNMDSIMILHDAYLEEYHAKNTDINEIIKKKEEA